ncbi:16S rRNA (cytosine(1402)-N(4))-methyltransferase [Candidatus Roizmanbacteria bacterium RIFCSPHIGHO2_02_FULL_37_13b]|uniref:Ribosomal RNA small subunit methyltransferase H n=1 Tax=Candidatus Roizmanbacteria bacterium RIFCSPLOWO2_02_FULL_36_11 TaxID=1802071 RepID=A0A1F7JG57_9BACT|nr:MAG: 16S rRNA (cytosine(1402)-N(4))-methyltransferase [Candidatus Roizmanbacteria bacterium RIFCSPHIGHO2_02_FULL_37_13b]OGK54611.1 MAG: 16S rRNA (cytosine(1402)-N(4))-methyltransferase [Candidatus Roizmanbacteria bacterium RIFCSPLOWO2_02_FULL_36_11]
MHTPVLLEQVIDALKIINKDKYIDATYGEGGHSREIIKRGGKVLAIEWDLEQFKVQSSKFQIGDLKLVNGNFKDIERIARENDFFPVDGILFDLGISMNQIRNAGKGFSYLALEEPLDMRINQKLTTTAADIINSSSVHELYEIFSRNSQEIDSGPIAEAISRARHMKKFDKVVDLTDLISGLSLRSKRESVLRRIFQALRMRVNDELTNIEKGIDGALNVLKPSGRLLIISFNQTEDRFVKDIFKKKTELKTQRPIRSRSNNRFEKTALLRVVSKATS